MITITCDGCGKKLQKGQLRYHVKIDVRAAYDELVVGLADLMRDHRAELEALIEQFNDRDPKDIEETVYKNFELDLCPKCQRAYLANPLHFHPEQGGTESPIDIDGFLRSLGIPPDDGNPTEDE